MKNININININYYYYYFIDNRVIERVSVEKAVGYYKRACEAVDDGESRLAYDTYKKVIVALVKLRV